MAVVPGQVEDTVRDNDIIPHQRLVEAIVLDSVYSANAELNTSGPSPQNSISGGEAPTEAEFNSLVTKFNALLEACYNAGVFGNPN